MARYLTYSALLVLLSFLYLSKCESSEDKEDHKSEGPIIIKSGGHRHRGDDIYLIGGKNCKTPTIIKKGKRQFMKKGKTIIIIGAECKAKVEKTKELDHDADELIKLKDEHDMDGLFKLKDEHNMDELIKLKDDHEYSFDLMDHDLTGMPDKPDIHDWNHNMDINVDINAMKR